MAEVIRKVENFIRVVLENVCSIGRQKTFTINVASNSEIFMSVGRFFLFWLILAPKINENHTILSNLSENYRRMRTSKVEKPNRTRYNTFIEPNPCRHESPLKSSAKLDNDNYFTLKMS